MTEDVPGARPRGRDLSEMTTDRIWALFGKSPVLPTESLEDYKVQRDGVIAVMQPRDYYEWSHLRPSVDCKWEAQRYRRYVSRLISMTSKQALIELLTEFAPEGIKERSRDQLVEGWFHDVKIRALVIEHLARYDFDEDTVGAQAMAMRSQEIARLSEMAARAEIEATAHIREIERHRDAAARRLTLVPRHPEPGARELPALTPAGGAA